MRKSPIDAAQSPIPDATQCPSPTTAPDASAFSPSGTVIVTSKSDGSVSDVSPCTDVGASVAHPTPGCHASTGKNDPSRMADPVLDRRSLGDEVGSVNVHDRSTFTVSPAATGRCNTSVVGFTSFPPSTFTVIP